MLNNQWEGDGHGIGERRNPNYVRTYRPSASPLSHSVNTWRRRLPATSFGRRSCCRRFMCGSEGREKRGQYRLRRRRAESGAGGLHPSRKWTPILRLDRRRRRKEEGKGGEEPTIVIQSRLPCRADLVFLSFLCYAYRRPLCRLGETLKHLCLISQQS